MSKREWREKEENPVDPVRDYSKYVSYQKMINSNNGQVNEKLLEDHIKHIKKDPKYVWEEVEVDFSTLKLGDRIRYTVMTPKGEYLFRTGGWVIALDEDHEWLVYMSHTKTTWTLQQSDCRRLFLVIGKRERKKCVPTIVFKLPGPETKYNAYLEKDGEMVRVGSFRDNWTLERFMASSKYNRALSGYDWEFG